VSKAVHPSTRRPLRVGVALLVTAVVPVGAAPARDSPAFAAERVPAPVIRTSVVPVPGDLFAPVGTSITFRGVMPSALAGLSVVGSATGRHRGTIRAVGAGATVFTPFRQFAGGERVTVDAPHLEVTGTVGVPYWFGIARPAPPTAAAAALRLVAMEDLARWPSPADTGHHALPACPVVTYRSAPNLDAKQVCMNLGVTTSGTQSGTYLFLTPFGAGAGIYADSGKLVWWKASSRSQSLLDESVVLYHGKPYLATWSGRINTDNGDGVVTLYNEHYQIVGKVTAGSGFEAQSVDLHEFQITRSGDAIIGIYDPVTVSTDGTTETVLQYVVQEVALVQGTSGIETGPVLFEWDSLSDVPTSQSRTPEPGSGTPWDYFHGNAITEDSDRNLVVSSRNTWGIYKIDDRSGDVSFGHVIWQVGAAGDSQLAEPWCYQHDIVALGDNKYSLFDDGGAGRGCSHPARALFITVNPATTPAGVTLDEAYTHHPPVYSAATGSVQRLTNGDVLVDWGTVREITEFGAARGVKMDLSLTTPTYRGLRFAWTGLPLTPPSIAASLGDGSTTVWASWNGSTEVAWWQVLGGSNVSNVAVVDSRRPETGFETKLKVSGDFRVLKVKALSSTGALLGTSKPVVTSGYLGSSSKGRATGVGAEAWSRTIGSGALHAIGAGHR